MKTPAHIKITAAAVLLAVVAILLLMNGISGPKYSWKAGATVVTLSQDSTILRVRGKGAMDYGYEDKGYKQIPPPWRKAAPLITDLVIDEGVTHIAGYAFSDLTGLTSITIPSSVTVIGEGAFGQCTGLTSVTIPNSVTSIGESAFYGCTGLTSVTISGSVKSVGRDAFQGCTGLKSITIEDGVRSIGEKAFCRRSVNNLGYLKGAFSDPDAIITPYKDSSDLISVTALYNRVPLGDNVDLMSVTIPNSVTFLGRDAFDERTSINFAADNPYFSFEDGVLFNKDKNVLIWYSEHKPDTVYGIPHGVTAIEIGALSGTRLTSITIPNSVTAIGAWAFYDLRLTSVTIPNSVTSIGRGAFLNTRLTSVTIPNRVTSIEDWTFYGTHLTSVIIPNGVTSIGEQAFHRTLLTSVTIPNSVTHIGFAAFGRCEKLVSVVIPNSVTSIGERAFRGCTGLTSIISPNPVPPKAGPDTFFDSGAKTGRTCLYVPANSINAYLSADGWKDFDLRSIKDLESAPGGE